MSNNYNLKSHCSCDTKWNNIYFASHLSNQFCLISLGVMTNKTNLIIPVSVHFKINNNPSFILITLEDKVGHFAHEVSQFVQASSRPVPSAVKWTRLGLTKGSNKKGKNGDNVDAETSLFLVTWKNKTPCCLVDMQKQIGKMCHLALEAFMSNWLYS